MLDSLTVVPMLALGFGYWLMKRNEDKEMERLRNPVAALPQKSTGDRELDSILGISTVASLLGPKP